MRTQAVKLFASLLVIAGFSSVALNAQPTVKSVGSVRHDAVTQVTVVFSNPVDPVSGATPGNYTFSGGAIAVTGARMMTGLPAANAVGVAENPAPAGRVVDNQCVVLTVTGLAVDATATITIQNIKDTATPPNTIASTTVTFKDSGYAWAESGTPALAGKVVALGTNGFDIFSAGSGQWANYDEVVMVYKQVTGDFDLKARVEFQDFSSEWARAGIMARESLNEGESPATQQGNWCATPPKPGTASRYVDVHPNPVQAFDYHNPVTAILIPGNNAWESHIRNGTYIGNNGGFQATDSANTTPGAPPYPNAWVRIQRVANDFHTFHGADGVNWDPAADRLVADFIDPATVAIDTSVTPCTGSGGNPLPMKPALFVGPAFGPETVNITPVEGQNRLFLYQVRFTAITVPYVRLVDPNPSGVLILIEDAPPPGTQVDTTSVQLTFDGNPVTASATKSGTTTTVAYKAPSLFLPNSSHSFSLTFKDNASPANSQKVDRTFTIPSYPTIPAGYAVASASTPGFNVRAHQFDGTRGPGDENSLANAEQQAANGFIDPTTGNPYPNTADLSAATGGIFAYNSVINWNNDGTAYGSLGTPADIGNWRDTNAAPYNIADTQFPGMPGTAVNNHGAALDAQYDTFIEEVTAYVQLKQGAYRMGVNSDDGFKASVAPGTPDIFGLQLGVFSGGRGSTDSLFDFAVAADGIYPFRLLWWNGAGGANLEWFTVNLSTGEKILLNETSNPNAVVVYQTAQGRAYVKSLLPANGYTGADTNAPIQIALVNGSTTVVPGSITLAVDGAQVTPTINSGATTTVTYSKPGGWAFGLSHTGTLIWGESTSPQTTHTNSFTFTVRLQAPDDLPANSFWIEAEDFDNSGGTGVPPAVNTMPYDLGAGGGTGPYDLQGAVLGVDYSNADSQDSLVYRTGAPLDQPGKGVNINNNTGGNFGTRRPGKFDMTLNYKIGWVDDGEWYNYTRNIPAGAYTAMAAISHGDAAGTPNDLRGKLSFVTSGVGTTTQTLQDVGTFNAPSSGGWGLNNMVQLKAPDGTTAFFRLGGGTKTLRFTTGNGDYDWFVLVPVTGVPPKVLSASPAGDNPSAAYGGSVKRNTPIDVTITDLSTSVVTSTVKLLVDGADVTSTATIAKNGDLTTVHYPPPSGLFSVGSHSYSVIFADNGTPALSQTNTIAFTVNVVSTPGSFLIEAEDFDTNNGQHQAATDTMPYTAGTYSNLNAVVNVDYFDNDAFDSFPYRPGLTNNVYVDAAGKTNSANANMNPTGDMDRGTWTNVVNYKIGWTDGADWFNYTRSFPAGTYAVYAALSHGDAVGTANDLRGTLQLVTGGVGTANQTVTQLGSFNAPSTGAWGRNALVPLMDPNSGTPEALSLSGTQTVRFTAASGDYDYLWFVPTAATPSKWITSVVVTGANITIKWIGGGTLQSTPSLPATTWTDLGTGGTFTGPVGPGTKFYRARQ